MRRGPWRTTGFPLALLAGLPASALVEDLDVHPSSFVTIEAGSGIFVDLPAVAGGTVFVPLAAQGAGSLRAGLEGRIRVDFRPADPTPTLAILGRSTLVTPVAGGSWLPGLPTTPALAAAAQAAATFGSASSLPEGLAALRELAITIDVAHPLTALSASSWSWPDGPFAGPGADAAELVIATGVVDFDSSLTPKTRLLLNEGARAALALSTASRARVRSFAAGEQLELRLPIDASLETTAADIHSSIPVRLRLELGGEIVARNFVPEPEGALGAAAGLVALGWLARRRRDTHRRLLARRVMQLAALLFLVGAACSDSTDREGSEPALAPIDVKTVTATTTGEANDAAGCADGTGVPCGDEGFEATALAAAPGVEVSVAVEPAADVDGLGIAIHVSNTTTRSEFDSTTQVDVEASFVADVPGAGAEPIRVRLLGTPEGHSLDTDATVTLSFPDHPETPPVDVPADGEYQEVALPPGVAAGALDVSAELHADVAGICDEEDCSGPWEAGVVYALDVFGSGNECFHDAQCPASENCVDGQCAPAGSCVHRADCPGGTICGETGCVAPGSGGDACVADGDCASDECNAATGTCNGCPGDPDCDGFHADDGCPDDPGTVQGCEDVVDLDAGGTVYCAEDCPAVNGSGGTCTRCGVKGSIYTLDCFAGTPGQVCQAGFFGSPNTCVGCIARSIAATVACGSFCRDDGNQLQCSGAVNECDAAIAGVAPTGCGDSPCELIVADEGGSEPRAELVVVKRTAPGSGDGSFEFLFDHFGRGNPGGTITTSGGVGDRELRFIAKPSRLNVFEDVPVDDGWSVSFDCDGPFESAPFVHHAIVVDAEPGQTIRCVATNTRSGGSTLRETIDAPETVEAVTVPGQTGPFVSVAGGGGWRVLNPLTGAIPSVAGETLQSRFFERGFLGARLIDDPGNATDFGVYTFGPSGISIGEWQTATLIGFGAGRDAIFPGGGVTGSSLLSLTGGNVSQVGYLDASGFPTITAPIVNSSELAGLGVPMSLFAASPTDQILIVTSGPTAGQNGRLLRIDPDVSNSAVVIGETDVDPRRVRCLRVDTPDPGDHVCVATNNGSDTITRFTWDGGANAAIVGTTPTGDGPISVALRADGANVIAATANFNDATYTIVVIGSDGSDIVHADADLPTGVLGPGGVTWLGDSENHLVFSGRDSDNLVVIVPVIPMPP